MLLGTAHHNRHRQSSRLRKFSEHTGIMLGIEYESRRGLICTYLYREVRQHFQTDAPSKMQSTFLVILNSSMFHVQYMESYTLFMRRIKMAKSLVCSQHWLSPEMRSIQLCLCCPNCELDINK